MFGVSNKALSSGGHFFEDSFGVMADLAARENLVFSSAGCKEGAAVVPMGEKPLA